MVYLSIYLVNLVGLPSQVASLRSENQELWSFDVGGSTQNLVASGGNAAVIH